MVRVSTPELHRTLAHKYFRKSCVNIVTFTAAAIVYIWWYSEILVRAIPEIGCDAHNVARKQHADVIISFEMKNCAKLLVRAMSV